jgi:DNA-binding NtrC family response regulator
LASRNLKTGSFRGESMKTQRVLVVDDDPVVRHLLVRYLTGANYFVFEAANATEAVQIALNNEIHLAIIDQTLGDRKGLHVAAEILGLHPHVAFVIISGYPQEYFASQGQFSMPNIVFLQKPFLPAHLVETVRDVLRGSSWPSDNVMGGTC